MGFAMESFVLHGFNVMVGAIEFGAQFGSTPIHGDPYFEEFVYLK